jgi:hypothetical protein
VYKLFWVSSASLKTNQREHGDHKLNLLFKTTRWLESSPSCFSAVVPTWCSGSFAPSPSRLNGKTWQASALKKSSLYCHHRARRRCGFLFLLLGTLFGADPQQPSTLRASGLRQVSRDWRCPFVFPAHRSSPGRGCFAAPFLLPQSEPSADVCCVVSRAAC